MKTFIMLFLFLVTLSCFAATDDFQQTPSFIQTESALFNCGRAVPPEDPTFCASFKAVAYCHCHDEHGMPPTTCSNMNQLLQVMIATYGNLWNACSHRAQKDVPQQECFDDWNFYTSHC